MYIRDNHAVYVLIHLSIVEPRWPVIKEDSVNIIFLVATLNSWFTVSDNP
jgi:hypothetical protein